MRIILANYRYFISGGPERYMFNVADVLTTHGHDVVPFSIQYQRNQPTPYSRYFVQPLGGEGEVDSRSKANHQNYLAHSIKTILCARC